MADFLAVIRRAVSGLSDPTPEMRAMVYERARNAVLRQLANMDPKVEASVAERQLDKLEEAIQLVEDEAERHQAPYVQSSDDSQDSVTPDPPAPEPGLTFELGQRGKLEFSLSGNPSDRDALLLGSLRSELETATKDLIALTIASNTHAHIGRIARRYYEALGKDDTSISIDLMYAMGVRLENSNYHLRQKIENKEYPEASIEISESLDSVVALNGAMLMLTERGRELQASANAYRHAPDSERNYVDAAVEVISQLIKDGKLVERDDAEELLNINLDAGQGPNPNRSSAVAHAANSNLFSTIATYTLMASGLITQNALISSHMGMIATSTLSQMFDNALYFFSNNSGSIYNLVSAANNDLSWLASFTRWLERKQREFRSVERIE